VVEMMGMNPRQMKKLMKQLGIKMEELEGVKEVVLKLEGKEIVLKDPVVTVMVVQGEKTYQIVPGSEEVREVLEIPEEDIELVMEQAGVDRETALKALKETKGDIAEAILKLTEE
jgi:nascent polypeptide-associated complex subunit alpha